MSKPQKPQYMFVPAYSLAEPTGRRRRVRVVQRSGVWCINTALPLNGEGYNVTHVPTRFAAITGITLKTARKAIKDFVALKGDWSFTTPEQMTPQQKRAGTRIKRRWAKASR